MPCQGILLLFAKDSYGRERGRESNKRSKHLQNTPENKTTARKTKNVGNMQHQIPARQKIRFRNAQCFFTRTNSSFATRSIFRIPHSGAQDLRSTAILLHFV